MFSIRVIRTQEIMRLFAILVLASFSLMGMMNRPSFGVLELSVNVQHDYGTLWIGIYDSEEAFLDKERAILKAVKVDNKGRQRVYVNNLMHGEYALALFHDLNGNDEMDFNWVGVPAEPFAFSKPVNSKWRLPEFSEVKVDFNESHKTINTRLLSWWDQ